MKSLAKLIANGSSSTLYLLNEGVHGIRPQVTLDLMSNAPFVSQANTRQFGRRISGTVCS